MNIVTIIPQLLRMRVLVLLVEAAAMVEILGSSVASGIGSFGSDAAAQQLATTQASSTNAACGQVVSGVVNLTANLNCSGDGIIVGGPNTVINMNGFSITGPGQDSSKVAIMVPNVDNVVVNGPGSLSNFQAGVLLLEQMDLRLVLSYYLTTR